MWSLIFEYCKNENLTLRPRIIHIDFKKVMHNVIHTLFTDDQLVWCTFHLGQCWWRKIQRRGLSHEYKEQIIWYWREAGEVLWSVSPWIEWGGGQFRRIYNAARNLPTTYGKRKITTDRHTTCYLLPNLQPWQNYRVCAFILSTSVWINCSARRLFSAFILSTDNFICYAWLMEEVAYLFIYSIYIVLQKSDTKSQNRSRNFVIKKYF